MPYVKMVNLIEITNNKPAVLTTLNLSDEIRNVIEEKYGTPGATYVDFITKEEYESGLKMSIKGYELHMSGAGEEM